MVLAFNNTGDFAKAVYGDSSAQHAGTNGGIAASNPSAAMTGGRRSKRQSQKQSKKGGKKQSQRQQRQSKKGGKKHNKSQRQQRGGK
jgi:hypothetical protein